VHITSKNLPVSYLPACANVFNGLSIFLGDLHNHSTNSNDCIAREKTTTRPADTFAFGREVTCLDFMAVRAARAAC